MKENLNNDLAESPETIIDIPVSEIYLEGIPRNRKIKPGEIYDVPYIESATIKEDPNTGEFVHTPATNLGKKYEHNLNQINFDKKFLPHRLQYDPTKIYDINELGPVARYFNEYQIQPKDNKYYIDFGQDINVNNLVQQYKNEHPDATRDEIQAARKSFRQLKDRGQHNYKTFKDARRYAGSTHESAGYKQFTDTMGLITGGAILAPWVAQGLAGASVLGWKAAASPIGQLLLGGYGAYELTSQNGLTKTWNHFKNGEYGKGTASLAGDILNILPLAAAYKGLKVGGTALNAGAKAFNFAGNTYRTFNTSNKFLNPAIKEAEYFYNAGKNFLSPTNIAIGITGGAIAGSADNATYNITKGKNYSVGDYLYTQVGKPGDGTGWESVARLSSEFANPFNWYVPGTYIKNKLGQNLVNGVLDTNIIINRVNDLRKKPILEVEVVSPNEVKRLFEQNPKWHRITDFGHRMTYLRNSDGQPWVHEIDKTKFLPFDKLVEIPETAALNPWEEHFANYGEILLTGRATDRYSRSSPITTRGYLPLTVNTANEYNSILNKAKDKIKWDYGGIYAEPFIAGLKFKPGDDPNSISNNGALIRIAPFRSITGELAGSVNFSLPAANISVPIYDNPIVYQKNNLRHPNLLVKGLDPFKTAGIRPGRDYGHFQIDKIPSSMATISNISDNPNLLVDENGNINSAGWEQLKTNLAQKLGVDVSEVNRMLENGRSPLLSHLLGSAYSAQTMPVPKGATRQQLVLGAFLHDIGRLQYMIGDDAIHANASTSLLKGLPIEGLTNDVMSAINWHASREQLNAFNKKGIRDGIHYPLLHAVSAADVSRGLPYIRARDKYPYLFGYETNELRLPLHLNEEEQMRIVRDYLQRRGYTIDESLPITEQWKQLQSIVEQANTYIRGVTPSSGGAEIVRDLGITDQSTQKYILATQPVRRYNGQFKTFDDRNFAPYIGFNKNDVGTVYVSNNPGYSQKYGELYGIRRGNFSDYRRIDGESPLQYMDRLMPVYLDDYSVPVSQITPDISTHDLPKLPDVTPEVEELYKRFGFTKLDAQLNAFGHKLDHPLVITPQTVSPGLHVTDLPHFRQNLMFISIPGRAAAFVGPYYKSGFHVLKDVNVPLSTFKKHGGKINKINK